MLVSHKMRLASTTKQSRLTSAALAVLLCGLLLMLERSSPTRGEQLSTVFVLETSDSDLVVSNKNSNNNNSGGEFAAPKQPQQPTERRLSDEALDQNTRIISDEDSNANKQHATRDNQKRSNQSAQASHVDSSPKAPARHSSGPQSVEDEQERQSVAAARRLDEESTHRAPTRNTATRSANQQRPARPTQSPAQVSTTIVYDHGPQTTPKSQERLLIIVNQSDDSYRPQSHKVTNEYELPASSSGSSSSGHDSSKPHQLAQSGPKRKQPSILISIQDASVNKQPGVPSAVILQPGPDGQSIVISTVNSQQQDETSGNNNKPYGQPARPPPPIVAPANEQPYREPINNPINQPHQQQHTTRRPVPVSDYTPTSSRPVLVAEQSHDERPQRPDVDLDAYGDGGAAPQRPPSRPTFPQDQQDERPPRDNGAEQSGQPQANPNEPKYPLNEKGCGVVHETKIVGGEEADPNDFLWMAAIIKSKPKDGAEARPFCGGSLITRRHILTAAHCLEGLAPRDVLVRLGSYDFDDSTASSYSADYAIDQFRVPGQYSKKTHQADIAIMRLKTPLQPTDNYKTVCMPQARRSYVGALGTVTGYGSQSQTFRRATPKLRQVTVPIWENRKCSVVYKRNMTESFLCAGFEEGGKDACQGDSGGPLMTEGASERMMIVGVVSHGIGCGSPGYPGVYTRTTTFTDWIEKNTRE